MAVLKRATMLAPGLFASRVDDDRYALNRAGRKPMRTYLIFVPSQADELAREIWKATTPMILPGRGRHRSS